MLVAALVNFAALPNSQLHYSNDKILLGCHQTPSADVAKASRITLDTIRCIVQIIIIGYTTGSEDVGARDDGVATDQNSRYDDLLRTLHPHNIVNTGPTSTGALTAAC